MQNFQKSTVRASRLNENSHEEVETVMRQSTAGQYEPDYPLQQTIEQDAVFERVDPYTLQVIAQLFPAPSSGLDFVARILRYATIIQNTLPGLEDLGDQVAVINTRTIRTLAAQIHWGYDTTHKYVSTFCAFGLLRRYKCDADHTLVFPLRRYTPLSSLAGVDHLITHSRPKVQQFAKKVRERFVKLNMRYESSFSCEAYSRPSESEIRLRKTLCEPMARILQSEGIDSDRSKVIVLHLIRDAVSRYLIPLQVVSEQEMIDHAYNGLPSRPSYLPPLSNKRQSILPHIPEEDLYDGVYPEGRPSSQKVYPEDRPDGRLSGPFSTKESSSTSNGRLNPMPGSFTGRPESTYHASNGRPVHPVEDSDMYSTKHSVQPAAPATTASSFPANSVMSIYEQAIDIDWLQLGLPSEFFPQLYQNLRTLFEHSAQKGFMAHTQLNIWTSVERNQIRKLAALYQLDFIPVYNTIVRATNRAHLAQSESTRSTSRQPHQSYVSQDASTPMTRISRSSFTFPTGDHPTGRKPAHVLPTHSSRSYRDEEDYNAPYQLEEEYEQDGYDNSRQTDYQSEYHYEEDSYPIHDTRSSSYYQADSYEYHYQEDSYTDRSSVADTGLPTSEESLTAEYHQPEDSYHIESSVEHIEDTPKIPSTTRVQRKKQPRQSRQSKGQQQAPEPAQDEQELPRGPQTVAEMYEQELARQRAEFSRIPLEVDQENYSEDFLCNYVTKDIITFFKNIYNNKITLRNELSIFFAEIFDRNQIGRSSKWYTKLLKDNDADSLCAAFVDTIILMHKPTKQPILQPGGFFNRRSYHFHANGIDAETNTRLAKYGSLTYKDFALAMADLARETNYLRPKD